MRLISVALALLPMLAFGQGTPQELLQDGENRAGAHDWKSAFTNYNMALQLKPDYAEAYNERGHAYYWTGDYPRAIADFTRAIELRPNYPNAFNNRGAAYMASGGHSGRALADFNQAIQLKPDFRNAYVNRANARGLRHLSQSLDDFHRAGMHPEWTAACVGSGLLLLAGTSLRLLALRGRLS
jgi:tetratricopeptide (TPR) repeat protein